MSNEINPNSHQPSAGYPPYPQASAPPQGQTHTNLAMQQLGDAIRNVGAAGANLTGTACKKTARGAKDVASKLDPGKRPKFVNFIQNVAGAFEKGQYWSHDTAEKIAPPRR